MFSRRISIVGQASAMLILVVLMISHGASSYAAPAFFPIIGCHSLVPIDVAIIRVMPDTEGLCCCADFAPPGYFDPPNTVVEAYTFVERFSGNGLDKASDVLLQAYKNSAKSNNLLINTGSLVHSYTVSVALAPFLDVPRSIYPPELRHLCRTCELTQMWEQKFSHQVLSEQLLTLHTPLLECSWSSSVTLCHMQEVQPTMPRRTPHSLTFLVSR